MVSGIDLAAPVKELASTSFLLGLGVDALNSQYDAQSEFSWLVLSTYDDAEALKSLKERGEIAISFTALRSEIDDETKEMVFSEFRVMNGYVFVLAHGDLDDDEFDGRSRMLGDLDGISHVLRVAGNTEKVALVADQAIKWFANDIEQRIHDMGPHTKKAPSKRTAQTRRQNKTRYKLLSDIDRLLSGSNHTSDVVAQS